MIGSGILTLTRTCDCWLPARKIKVRSAATLTVVLELAGHEPSMLGPRKPSILMAFTLRTFQVRVTGPAALSTVGEALKLAITGSGTLTSTLA